MHCLRSSLKKRRMSVKIPDSEVFNKNETKREGEKRGTYQCQNFQNSEENVCTCFLFSSCIRIPKVRSCRRLRTAAIAARLRTAVIAANSESSPAEPHSYGETFDIILLDRKWKHFQKWRVHGISVFGVQWSPEITKFHMLDDLRWMINIWD